MKPKNLSEVKSQDEFLEYLIDNYYHILGEGNGIVSVDIMESYYTLTASPSLIVLSESLTDNTSWFAEYMKIPSTGVCSVQEYREKIKSLRNKPSFEDHPDAKCFVQDSDGCWYKNIKTSHVIAQEPVGSWVVKNIVDAAGWAYVQLGGVLGDWKQTFEKAPEKKKEEKLACSEKQNWGTSYAVLGELVDAHKQVKEYKDKYENLAIQYNTIVLGIHSILDEKRSAEKELNEQVKSLEMQIAELKSENQELKTKIDRTKQALS